MVRVSLLPSSFFLLINVQADEERRHKSAGGDDGRRSTARTPWASFSFGKLEQRDSVLERQTSLPPLLKIQREEKGTKINKINFNELFFVCILLPLLGFYRRHRKSG
jgi:hypothetical protein